MDKHTTNILLGLVVIGVIIGVYYYYNPTDEIQTNTIVATPENVGVVDGTQITCPVGYTVISTVGGTPEQDKQPQCKAPNPSVEVFDCGDSIVDVDGNVLTVECLTLP
jgi:hypothetical protein